MLPPPFRPMLASPVEDPYDDPGHLFEPKWDGFRCLAFCDHGEVALYSRTGRLVTPGYPEVATALTRLDCECVLDGELVVLDKSGVPRFQLMQQRNYASAPPRRSLDEYPVLYVVFDICWRDGLDVRERALGDRRALLEGMEEVTVTQAVVGEGRALYEASVGLGFEGVIGKDLASAYRPGTRSRAWRKVKSVETELVVVAGFTRGTGARSLSFGSLVMAKWSDGGWVHAGEVGTGFDDVTLRMLRAALDEIAREEPVMPGAPPGVVTWVEPGIVIKVEHRGWTEEGRLRAPSFKSVAHAVDPTSVRRGGFGGRSTKAAPQDTSRIGNAPPYRAGPPNQLAL